MPPNMISTPALPAAAPAFQRRFFAVSILLLAIASLLPGIGAIGATLFVMDDGSMIYKSPYIGDVSRGAKPAPLSQVFSRPNFTHYAPLHELLIYGQWLVFGFNVVGFRLVSLLLHFGAALACWRMLKALTRRDGLSLGVALAFALHPAQCESVAWVVEQKTLASGLFVFAALAVWFNTTRPAWLRVTISTVLMALACLFKTPALVVGPLVLLFETFLSGGDQPLSRRWLRAVPLLAIGFVFVKLTFWALGPMHQKSNIWGLSEPLFNLPGELCLYVRIGLLPWTVSFFHQMDLVASAGSSGFLVPLLLLAVLAAAGWLCVQAAARRLYVFCVLGFVAAVGPMTMSMWAFPAYDRFAYYGLPFLLLALALIVEGLLLRIPSLARSFAAAAQPGTLRLSAVTLALWAAPLGVLGVLAGARGALFASESAVMRHAAERAPRNAYPHAALANLLMHQWHTNEKLTDAERGKIAEALWRTTERARQCWNFAEYYHSPATLLVASANVFKKTGMPERAESYLLAVLLEPRWERFELDRKRARALLNELAPVTFPAPPAAQPETRN
jgi:hypothetical protein